jgi:hypothetical protein
MRYRDLYHAGCSWCCLLDGDVWHEGLAVLGDAVDDEQQFVHAGDQGDLGQLAGGEQPLVVRAQPGIAAHRAQCWHPHGGAQLGVADGGDGAADRLPFARLFEGGDGADISGERAAAAEVGGVADGGDDAGRGLGTDAVDGGEQLADLVLAQFAVEVAVEIAQAKRWVRKGLSKATEWPAAARTANRFFQ